FREIRREAQSYKEPVLVINCNPDVARVLQGEERNELRHLMDRYNKSIQVKAQQNYHREQFDIYGRPAQQVERPTAVAAAAVRADPAGQERLSASGPGRGGGQGGRGGRDRGRDRYRDRDRAGSGTKPPVEKGGAELAAAPVA